MDATTELSAINGMLATIGEAPINTLEDTGLIDVSVAQAAIQEVKRSVLVEGWAFNTDVDYPLYPEGFSPFEIKVPPNAMSVLPSPDYEHVVVRGNRLYNRTTRSFDFQGSGAIPCEIIWSMTFEELPEVTRQYVYVRACRLFQTRTTASPLLHQITEQDERTARWSHRKHNVRVNRKRFLYDSASVFNIHANR